MTSVVVGVETDQVAVKNTEENVVSNGENTVNLAAGERRVQEKADLDVSLPVPNLLTKHGWQQHQVVVVNPNKVTILHIFGNRLGEHTIRLGVGIPGRLLEGDLTGVIVE